MGYQTEYNQSVNDREAFWRRQADAIAWFKKPTQILTEADYGQHLLLSVGCAGRGRTG